MFALEQMKLSRLSFVFEARENGRLPSFLGSTIRGSFGHALKDVGCPGHCSDTKICLEECSYAYCFETPIPDDSKRMRRMSFAPHPFWFEVPYKSKRNWRAGDRIHVTMVLVGKAIKLFPYIMSAAEKMGHSGFGSNHTRFCLVELRDSFVHDEARPIWRGGKLHEEPSVLQASQLVQPEYAPKVIELECLTPMRIFEKKKMLQQLTFRSFARSLLSRFTSLQYFHCGTQVELDFKGILAEAEQVNITQHKLHSECLNRQSNRQNRKIPLDGLLGTITWQGSALSLFWPLVQIGQILHIGKGTAMGLGQYRITQAM